MKRWLFVIPPGFLALSLLACEAPPPPPQRPDVDAQFQPVPDQPPQLADNPLTPAMIDLGRLLFFDPRLSASWLISCNTCHNLGLAGVDLLETSIGHGWQAGPRNAPTVLNAVFHVAQFWDGRAEDLEAQATGPIQAAVEMNSTPDRLVATLVTIPGYVDRFRQAFPDETDPVTLANAARAIEAFEATLLTPDAPFDRFLKGDAAAMTAEQMEGFSVFRERGCVACHGGMTLGGQAYFPFGVVERPTADILPEGDRGRFQVTRSEGDAYVFKAPSLRNVALTEPYFHSGKVWELSHAVEVMSSAQLGIQLSPDETRAVVAYLTSLTGVMPRLEYPVLPPHTDDTPRPYTDPAPIEAAAH